MNEKNGVVERVTFRDWVLPVVRAPFRVLAAMTEQPCSLRGLAVGLLSVSALMTVLGGLRPPLRVDIAGMQIPLVGEKWGVGPIPGGLPGDGISLPGNGGILLLGVIAASMIAVLIRPRLLGLVGGILLTTSMSVQATLCLNHPGVIEAMDMEFEQRARMVRFVNATAASAASSRKNARISEGPGMIEEWGGVKRGRAYLLYMGWIPLLAALGVVIAPGGALKRRCGRLGLWALLGAVLSCALCGGRLRAEYYWAKTLQQERDGDVGGARRSLERAFSILPELSSLQRSWFMGGLLDHQAGIASPRERFYRACKLARIGDIDASRRILEELQEGASDHKMTVSRQEARVLAMAGLLLYRQGQLVGAQDAWRRARRLDPDRLDCLLYLGHVQTRLDESRPQAAEAYLELLLAHLADRPLRADVLAGLGDAYFAAGRMQEARALYRRSLRAFSLPTAINHRALSGLTGL